jgi:hypothetical protein
VKQCREEQLIQTRNFRVELEFVVFIKLYSDNQTEYDGKCVQPTETTAEEEECILNFGRET